MAPARIARKIFTLNCSQARILVKMCSILIWQNWETLGKHTRAMNETNNTNCMNDIEMSSQMSEKQMNARTKRKRTIRATTWYSTYALSLSKIPKTEFVRQRLNAKNCQFKNLAFLSNTQNLVISKTGKEMNKEV